MSTAEVIESIIIRDCGRGIELLATHTRGHLATAASALLNATAVAVVTGFAVPTDDGPAPETDGPIGAAALAAYVDATGRDCFVVTDSINEPVCAAALSVFGTGAQLAAVADRSGIDPLQVALRSRSIDLIVFLERLGPNENGRYLSMGGVDMTDVTPPLDVLADQGIHAVGIGDGGNEVGMGLLPHASVAGAIARGDQIHCRTRTDELILAGVSNWGAWALVAAAALGERDSSLAAKALSVELSRAALQAAVDAGAVDGVQRRRVLSVDGIEPAIHEAVLTSVRTVAGL